MTNRIALLVFAFFLVLCVRPASADGTVTAAYSQWGAYSSGGALKTIQADPVTACVMVYSPNAGNMARVSATFVTTILYNCTIDGLVNSDVAKPYPLNTAGTCPANSTGTSPACSCVNGYVPSSDGINQAAVGASPPPSSCIASTNTVAVIPKTYGTNHGSSVCATSVLDGTTSCGSGTVGNYTSAAAACAANNSVYANENVACTLVSGNSCVCSVTYSDGTPPYISIMPIEQTNNCPSGNTSCAIAANESSKSANVKAAAGAAAGAQSAATGATIATQLAAVTAAINAAATAIASNAATAQSISNVSSSSSGSVVNNITNNTLTLPSDLAKTADVSGAAASIVAKLDANGIYEKGIFDDLSASGVAAAPASVLPSSSDAVSSVLATNTSVTNMMNGLDAGMVSDRALSWWEWSPSFGASTCAPFTKTIYGKVVTWDLCVWVANIRDALGWIFALFASWSIFGLMFRKSS